MRKLSCVLVLALLAAAGCHGAEKIVGDPVQTVESPDGVASAVVTKANGGATVSFVFRVYLRKVGASAAVEVLRADKTEGLSVTWADDRSVVVKMPCGRIFAYQNFFDVLSDDGRLLKRGAVQLETAGLCAS